MSICLYGIQPRQKSQALTLKDSSTKCLRWVIVTAGCCRFLRLKDIAWCFVAAEEIFQQEKCVECVTSNVDNRFLVKCASYRPLCPVHMHMSTGKQKVTVKNSSVEQNKAITQGVTLAWQLQYIRTDEDILAFDTTASCLWKLSGFLMLINCSGFIPFRSYSKTSFSKHTWEVAVFSFLVKI